MIEKDRDGIVSFEHSSELGLKIVEMADRVRIADKCAPGTAANWAFEMDDVTYNVVVTVRRAK